MTVRYEDALEALRERLGDAGFEHSVRTAETAAALALIYGVDVEASRLAGLLHDWDREAPREELPERASAAGVELTDVDRSAPYLLHAKTGARALADVFPGIDPQVLRAVARHTVGAEDMGDVDRVVWIADLIEPGRRFPGVNDLREAVGEMSLDALFALGYEHSLLHIIKRRKRLHPDTVAVWNSLVDGEGR